jgi:DNA polymerase-3 subunit alpha
VGKRALESLIKVGALDQFSSRTRLLASLDRMVSVSSSAHKATDIGQMSLFGEATGLSLDVGANGVLVEDAGGDLNPREVLQWERELVGVYISEHPLHRLSDTIRRVVSAYSAQLTEADHNRPVTMAGIVTYVRPHTTKSGKAMAFAGIEDLFGQIEVIIWPSTWDETRELWQPDRVLLLRGKIDAARGEPKLLCDTATTNFDVLEPVTAKGEVIPYTPPGVEPAASMEPPPPFEHMQGIDLAPEDFRPDNEVDAGPPAGEDAGEHEELGAGPAAPVNPAPLPVTPPPASTRAARPANASRSHVLVVAQRSGDVERDKRSIQRIHGALVSQPGRDTFSIALASGDDTIEFDFPNDTTCCTPELLEKLARIVPPDSIHVSPGEP